MYLILDYLRIQNIQQFLRRQSKVSTMHKGEHQDKTKSILELFKIKIQAIIIESSLKCNDFYYTNYHISGDCWDSYLINDIQKSNFKNLDEQQFFIFTMDTINSLYLYGKMRKCFMSIQIRKRNLHQIRFQTHVIFQIIFIHACLDQHRVIRIYQFILKIVKLLNKEKNKLILNHNKSFQKTTLQLKKRMPKEENIVFDYQAVVNYQEEQNIYLEILVMFNTEFINMYFEIQKIQLIIIKLNYLTSKGELLKKFNI
ncbi:unnamed protein product [Paramecium pentaurelia]|uniref:Uncharacterized protein n=1 Tax=Paramecium pentaurelia TaxID=43138 RepID=A0A8S1SL59_9CILI|nr:unnamed protein product [Paramecium pentaurelia]